MTSSARWTLRHGLLLTSIVGAALAFAVAGCGNSVKALGTGTGGTGGGTGTGGMNVICGVTASACTSNGQCCSNACDPVMHTCTASVSSCSGSGSSCAVATDCCNLQCNTTTKTCATASSCIADNQNCTSSGSCCSGDCANGTCQPLNTACATAGNPCGVGADGGSNCCSGLCTNGKCVLGASWCIQPGDVCGRDVDCCSGYCSRASGATTGTCQQPGTTGAGQCMHDGTLCGGNCGACCSKVCGPWAATGVNICQPGLGCKILNSLCTTSAECCGGDTGDVSCNPATGPTDISIGVCGQNHSNQVPGGICRLTGGPACTNAQSDCECAVSPKVACCAFDRLGLPRCIGSGACAGADGGTGVFVGTDPNCCKKPGDVCATSAECCNLIPCVPDDSGVFRCLTSTPTDAGVVCVAAGGACTATGDCCQGYVCNIAPGAPKGTCGTPPTPPPADGGVCAYLGQNCSAATPCCAGAGCTYTPTNTACAGQANCTCTVSVN